MAGSGRSSRRAGFRAASCLSFLLLVQADASSGLQDRRVVRAPIHGVIEMGVAPYLERTLLEAEASGAVAVVLDIDTPGGRVDATQRITDAISRSSVPVFAFVNPSAYSAGAIIAIASEGIFMRSGSVMGAATPVDGSGERASEKMVSAMRAQMRALAELRGRDAGIAEAMVDERLEVPGVSEPGSLLTLTAAEAEEIGYAVQVRDWDDVLSQLELEGAQVTTSAVNWAERLVRFFTHPVVAPLLMTIGVVGVMVEIRTPGLGVAGAVGLLSLALHFGAHFLVGLAGAEDILLVLAGVGLVAVEVLVIPGFGVIGILGGGAIIGGLFMMQLGDFPTASNFIQVLTGISVGTILVVVTGWALLRRVPKSGRLQRSGVLLPAQTTRDAGYTSADVRREMVGREGVALTDLRPSGVGLFGDERVDIVAEGGWIEEGAQIRIASAEGYRHTVRRARRQPTSR